MKNIFNYKKPAFWIVFCAIIACLAVVIYLMTSPFSSKPFQSLESGPGNHIDPPPTVTFYGVINEINDGTILVQPSEGSAESRSSDLFAIPIQNMKPSPEPQVGDTVEITYDGYIDLTYPATLGDIYSVTLIKHFPP